MVEYAIFMALALVVALVLRRFFPSPLTRRQRIVVGLGAFVGAMFGAKLPFVILGIGWLDPGKTILAGLAGGYLGVELAKILAGIRVKTGDTFAVPVAAAVSVGRFGCYFNGCCAPTQLHEVAFHAVMALVLWHLWRRGALRRQLFKLYLIAYGVFRFGTEYWRAEPRLALGLTAYQWGSLALIALMSVLWAVDRRGSVAEPVIASAP